MDAPRSMLPCAGRRAVRGRRHHGVLTPIPVSAARRPTSSLAHRSKLPAGGTGSPLLPTPSRGRSKTSDPVHSPTHGDERPHCGCRRGRCIWYSGAGGNHRGEAPLAQSVDAEDALGIIVGNCGIQNPTTYAVVNNLATAAVVLSLPLLLFSTDLRQVRRKGLSVLFALFVGAVAVVASATACHFAFRSRLDQEAWKITALMTAVLIGGTPNMASVRTALGIDSELYVTVHTAEVVVGAVYVLLIMTAAKPALSRVLPPYRPVTGAAKADPVPGRELPLVATPSCENALGPHGESSREPERAVDRKPADDGPAKQGESEGEAPPGSGELDAMAATAHDLTRLQRGVEPYAEMTRRELALPLLGALALDLLIVLASAGVGLLFQSVGYFELVTILLITALSVGAACAERVRRIRHTFTLGQLFILVFCLSVGMLADLEKLAGTSPWIFAFVAAVMVCSVLLQILFYRLTAVDVDTGIVASVQLFCSPPFIGIACQAVNNTELLLPGISAGLIGYALGNYIGSGTGKLWEGVAP